jgi:hypothetical protein
LVEIDSATIDSDPRGNNYRNICERALDERAKLTIPHLGDVVGLRHPMPTVCALICQKRFEADLDKHLTLFVRRAGHSHHSALLTASHAKIGVRDR